MGLFSDTLEDNADRFGALVPFPRQDAIVATFTADARRLFECPACPHMFATDQALQDHLFHSHTGGTFYVRINDQVAGDVVFLEEPCSDLRVIALGAGPVYVSAEGPNGRALTHNIPPGGMLEVAGPLGLQAIETVRGRVKLHVATPTHAREYEIYIRERPTLDFGELDELVSTAQGPLANGHASKWRDLNAAANEGSRKPLARRYLRGFAEYLRGYDCEYWHDCDCEAERWQDEQQHHRYHWNGARWGFEQAFGLLRNFSSAYARDARSVLAFKMNAFPLLRQSGPDSAFWQAANFFQHPTPAKVTGGAPRRDTHRGVWLDEFQEGVLRIVACFYEDRFDRADAGLRHLPSLLAAEGNNHVKQAVLTARVAQRLGEYERSCRAYRQLVDHPIFDSEARSALA